VDKSQYDTEDSEHEEDDICHKTRNFGFAVEGINILAHLNRDFNYLHSVASG